jgi:hypothetical protein
VPVGKGAGQRDTHQDRSMYSQARLCSAKSVYRARHVLKGVIKHNHIEEAFSLLDAHASEVGIAIVAIGTNKRVKAPYVVKAMRGHPDDEAPLTRADIGDP